MNDQEILRMICSRQIDAAVRVLYKEFPNIRLLLMREGGQDDWIQEIFNDSLVLLIEKFRNPNLL